jgi:hypothetical protein
MITIKLRPDVKFFEDDFNDISLYNSEEEVFLTELMTRSPDIKDALVKGLIYLTQGEFLFLHKESKVFFTDDTKIISPGQFILYELDKFYLVDTKTKEKRNLKENKYLLEKFKIDKIIEVTK